MHGRMSGLLKPENCGDRLWPALWSSVLREGLVSTFRRTPGRHFQAKTEASFSVLMPYPDTTRSSKKNESAGGSTSLGPAAAPTGAAAQNATALVNSARNRAVGIANAARDWLHPPSFPDWFSSLSQIESLTTVMFSPLGGHPAYRSESLARALQLMQQQQQQRQRSAQTSSGSDVVLHSGRLALPPSSELLKAEIPESQAPLSLFQGFAAAYPSLTSPGSPSTSPKRSRHRRKKHGSTASIGASDISIYAL